MPPPADEDAGVSGPPDVCEGLLDCQPDCKARGGRACAAVRCDAPARCLLNCKDAKECDFASCSLPPLSCPKNVKVCNRDCP